MTPTPAVEVPIAEKLEVRKEILDLSAKSYVTLVKQSDPPAPITSMEDFVTRMNHDAPAILAAVNSGYLEHFKNTLAENESVEWKAIDEDDAGNETLVPFAGVECDPSRVKQFQLTIVNVAKSVFQYAKQMIPGDVKKNREAKAAAKQSALEMLLSNPAAVEALRK
jgi:predicted RNA-binding protein with RPS1 domain